MKNKLEIIQGKEYQWNPHLAGPLAHTNINLVITELKEIEETRGSITAELVLESSKNKKSILHEYFQWDDAKAAHSWRMRQARELLARIEVRVIKNGESRFIRVYETTRKPTHNENKDKDKDKDYGYVRFDLLTVENIEFIKKIAIGDLNRVKNKLIIYNCDETILYIDKAIASLNKEPEIIPIEADVLGNVAVG